MLWDGDALGRLRSTKKMVKCGSRERDAWVMDINGVGNDEGLIVANVIEGASAGIRVIGMTESHHGQR
jgi:hypothetical protein